MTSRSSGPSLHTHVHHRHAHAAHAHLTGMGLPAHDRAREAHREWRPLLASFVVTSTVMVAEVVGGLLTGSLALLSDAGHMLTDVAALGLALVAFRVSERPPTLQMSFGYHRFEILAALLNGVTLWGVVAFLAWEAVERLREPAPIEVQGMLLVAGIGLVANLASAALLVRVEGAGLNVRGAFLHVLADLLGSVGTLVAGALILFTGWLGADPVASLLICGLILVSSWRLIRDAVNVLMEATPAGVDVEAIQATLMGEPGVRGVHELHVWAVTPEFQALSAHVEVEPEIDRERMLRRLNFLLRERFGLDHTTLQLEEPRLPRADALQIQRRPARS